MQRPRRTSEFQEELGTATKRQSRAPQRLTAPSPVTAQKYNPTRTASTTRSSRIPKSGSLERGTVHLGSTSKRPGLTPQKTPLKTQVNQRVLFSAEKKQTALHNDKKWVQERTQRITEYLRSVVACGNINGISADFFARPGCLRQMSIKQFVAIFNYFLRFISGNRFTVGPNHVDEIVNILQKIHYPYQVNKSWLKTPNTQHSFGNVVVLLDFLMEFTPTHLESDNDQHNIKSEKFMFDFEEPQQELTASSMVTAEQCHISPDVEFQAHLLQNSEDGFMLWDKQMMQDLNNLQEQTCQILIKKQSGVISFSKEMAKLEKTLEKAMKARPSSCEEEEKEVNQLEQDLRLVEEPLKQLTDDLKHINKKFKELDAQKESKEKECNLLYKEIPLLKKTVKNQIYSIKQRDSILEQLTQLKHMVLCEERTLQDLDDKNREHQVSLSRTRQQLTDLVAQYNQHMQDICYTHQQVQQPLQPNVDDLQLSFQFKKQDLEQPNKILNELVLESRKNLEENTMKQKQIDLEVLEIKNNLETVRVQVDTASTKLQLCQKSLQQDVDDTAANFAELEAKEKELQIKLQEKEHDLQQVIQKRDSLQSNLAHVTQRNEDIMAETQRRHEASRTARLEFLNIFKPKLLAAKAKTEEFLKIAYEQSEKNRKVQNGFV